MYSFIHLFNNYFQGTDCVPEIMPNTSSHDNEQR